MSDMQILLKPNTTYAKRSLRSNYIFTYGLSSLLAVFLENLLLFIAIVNDYISVGRLLKLLSPCFCLEQEL